MGYDINLMEFKRLFFDEQKTSHMLSARVAELEGALKEIESRLTAFDNCPPPCQLERPCDDCEERVLESGEIARRALAPSEQKEGE